ncbi:T9SS type B sorting domain-containing protein [Flavobacterium poyangense]|uniref:T9SS type B sorting domain-containing protein n=1 Tax=Flavobacterium poyangense TaxID=2204302 RepID=UPI00141FA62A|nr:T9SS type B sorting domain-containing protein [Flavobacterium sp. JXAS1]
MNIYKLRVLLFSLLFSSVALYSQVTYEFCMTAKYGKTIVLDFKIHNNTTTPISNYNFEFNWKDVSNVIMWSGLDVIQNGTNGVVELRKTTWGNALPVGTTTYSITMDYELGMFPPDEGVLNGATIKGKTCYTPPAHENFKCERNFSDLCTVKPVGSNGHEIRIGEGSAFAWNAPIQIYIPENRKSWAIAMAVSHSIFTNLMGFDVMSINECFATAIQESNASCEGSRLVAPSWVTTTYPHNDTNRPLYCYDTSGAVAVGYFQQEMGGSWTEMEMNYPCFIPQVDRNNFIGTANTGSNFEFQSIVKAYHDYRNVAYWQYVKCWNPIDFFKKSNDPYAAVKIIGMAYNQGMNHTSFDDLFNRDRAASIGATNIMDRITPSTPTATNRLYAEQINRLTKVLDNKVAEINWTDAVVFGVTNRAAHSFRGYYDAQFTWNDVEEYIKKITPFYASFGVQESNFVKAVKPVFDHINGGNPISFRYQMSEVVEAIVTFLPAFDPKKGLAEVYGGSGANNCFAPTAKMEGFNASCGKDLSLKVYFSGKAPYTFTYKKTDVSPAIVFQDITTSQNPYTIQPAQEGTYVLTAVRDDVSAGEVVCSPIELKYIGTTAVAKLVKYGGTPCSGIGSGIQVEINSTAPGPYTIEYKIDGIAQPAVTINNSPYTLITSPAPAGTYKLTKISVAGCDTTLNETLIIDATPAAPVTSAKLSKFGALPCSGIGPGIQIDVNSTEPAPYVIEYEKDGVAQPAVTINNSPYTLITSPAPTGTYKLTKISVAGCDTALNETLIIDATPAAPVTSAKLSKFGALPCSGIGPGIQIDVNSTEPAPYTVEYEKDGIAQPAVTINNSPYILITSPAPAGTYQLTKISVAGCDTALNETLIIDATPTVPVTNAKLSKFGALPCSGIGPGIQIDVNSTEPAPYVIEYEKDGVAQPTVTINSSPYTLITSPAPTGTYKLTKISVAGCDTALNETLIIDATPAAPVTSAKLSKFGALSCSGIGPGIQIDVNSTEPAPYVIEYEKDGVAQPVVTINSSPYTLIASPAPAGTYQLTKISVAGCDTTLNESLQIDSVSAAPNANVKLSEYGASVCQGKGPGIQVEINSIGPGPYTIEYEVNGIIQPAVTINSSPYILVTSPASSGTYKLTKIFLANCDLPLHNILTIKDNFEKTTVKIEGDLHFCNPFKTVLKATINPTTAQIVSYQWRRNNTDIANANTENYYADRVGDYTVVTTDKNGCVFTTPIVTVIEKCDGQIPAPLPIALDYPKFFTPNGDGYNDTWHIKNFDQYKKPEIRIFDRFGKFIIQLSEHSNGWDGTYNNNLLFATDYWFVMTYDDKDNPLKRKTMRGHFSLKR